MKFSFRIKDFHRVGITCCMVLCCTVVPFVSVKAQSKGSDNKVMNLPNFDNKIIHFGFLLGPNMADFRISYNPKHFGVDSVFGIQSKRESGFNLGIISDLRLAEYLNLRFVPTLSFSARLLEYTILDQNGLYNIDKRVESVYLDFPLLFKYKSERAGNFRAYLIGGGKYSLDMASQKDINSKLVKDILIKIDDNDFSFVFGVGFDFYLTYFKFSPELTYSLGLKNILIQENNILTKPIDRLTSKIIQISFNFE
ncbi:MAG: PorT family protein [Bacteroidia bacterium]|nr:PorT family protein [Bacteroidia bacterium]